MRHAPGYVPADFEVPMAAPIGAAILTVCRAAAAALTRHIPANTDAEFRQLLATTLIEVLQAPPALHTAAQAEKTFALLLQRNRTHKPLLTRFMRGWGDTHLSADLVGVQVSRLHAQGAYHAASNMLEVIADDMGTFGLPHRVLFARFADTICAPGSWQQDSARVPECTSFRNYLHDANTRQPLEIATMVTAAAELWNVGEYTMFAHHVRPWLEHGFDLGKRAAAQAATYVQAHTGETELKHFRSVVAARELLSRERGEIFVPALAAAQAGSVVTRYLQALGDAYTGLYTALRPGLEGLKSGLRGPGLPEPG